MAIEIESPEQLGYDTIVNNLSESSVSDRRLRDLGIDLDLDDLLLCYGDHLGDPELREAIGAIDDVSPESVLVTPGAAASLYFAATSILEPGDHALVVRTNYATNLETPRAIGADLETFDLRYDERWVLDVDRLRDRIRPETKLVSVTYPHNPTGAVITGRTLAALVEVAEASGVTLVVDETYRELAYLDRLPLAATLSSSVISMSSMSKSYGLPGLRIGWAVCDDPATFERLLAAKEQVVICGATLDEAIAARVLAQRDRILPSIRADVTDRLALVRAWISAQDVFEWVEPEGGVVGLVRVRPDLDFDAAKFHHTLLHEFGTYVGAGHWFELDDRYFRLGFGWPTHGELRAGLESLSAAVQTS
ncbi:MAG TPA: pyridoxal phosphate-dependent aminotransferase [Acidimicrobiales bacterium]|jgi:aspartate/methionine/tyrosine aminotransferase|nr:pyridoxal phosphate-dependent aminotransferase [Acidimicrobiales bacterium]